MLELRLANGVHAQLYATYGTVEEDRFDVYGSDGKLVSDRYNSLCIERVPPRASGGIATSLRRAVKELARLPYGLEKRRAPGREPSYQKSLHAFVDAAQNGRPSSPTLDDGLAALRAIEMARAASGRPTTGR